MFLTAKKPKTCIFDSKVTCLETLKILAKIGGSRDLLRKIQVAVDYCRTIVCNCRNLPVHEAMPSCLCPDEPWQTQILLELIFYYFKLAAFCFFSQGYDLQVPYAEISLILFSASCFPSEIRRNQFI